MKNLFPLNNVKIYLSLQLTVHIDIITFIYFFKKKK
jgi:hypothetical protein